MIDTDGSGYHLTSAADGVMFDVSGSGIPVQTVWTEKDSTTGFLVLPTRGQVFSARENMFGNHTAQPATTDQTQPPNGFLALSVYDLRDHGGNADGVIDAGDAVWPSLRVWIDSNHDGVAQPEELYTLAQIGVARILLTYELSNRVDHYGNQFRFKGHLVPAKNDKVDRKVFDVILAQQ